MGIRAIQWPTPSPRNSFTRATILRLHSISRSVYGEVMARNTPASISSWRWVLNRPGLPESRGRSSERLPLADRSRISRTHSRTLKLRWKVTSSDHRTLSCAKNGSQKRDYERQRSHCGPFKPLRSDFHRVAIECRLDDRRGTGQRHHGKLHGYQERIDKGRAG